MDGKLQTRLDTVCRELETLHGGELLAVCLVGDAATMATTRRAWLSLAVVVQEVTPEVLARARRHVPRLHRRRIDTPLLLDPLYIERATDVFPIELLDLSERHRLLRGEDPFVGIEVDQAHLRLEVEEQLRGKMLHLWESYLGAGRSRRKLRRLLSETPTAFAPILRGMLHLRGAVRASLGSELARTVESTFEIAIPTMRMLNGAAERRERLPRGQLETLFTSYLNEVRSLVRLIDRL